MLRNGVNRFLTNKKFFLRRASLAMPTMDPPLGVRKNRMFWTTTTRGNVSQDRSNGGSNRGKGSGVFAKTRRSGDGFWRRSGLIHEQEGLIRITCHKDKLNRKST